MSEHLQPESQTVSKCAEVRQGCRDSIFEKMDEQHQTQMDVLGEIKEDMAYKKGYEKAKAKMEMVTNSTKKNGNGKKVWRDVLKGWAITWGPPLLFIIIIGLIAWFRSLGWLN